MDAGAFATKRLRELDKELAPAAKRVLARADEEAVHDLRVAIRRIRTFLKVTRDLYGRFHADSVRRAFTAVHQATGALRDEEALEETFAKLPQDDAEFVAWRTRRRLRERVLRRDVVRRIRIGELSHARRLLDALLVLPLKPSRQKDLGKFARRAASRAAKDVEKLRDAPDGDAEKLHDLRIAYKHLRYTLELFEPALPLDVTSAKKPAERFQKRLGDIHDADVALLTISRARGLAPASRARVHDALIAHRAKKVDSYQREMHPDPEAPSPAPTPSADAREAARTKSVSSARAQRERGGDRGRAASEASEHPRVGAALHGVASSRAARSKRRAPRS